MVVTMDQHAKNCMARTRAAQREGVVMKQEYDKGHDQGWEDGYRAAAENAKDIERQGGTVSEDLLPYMGMEPVLRKGEEQANNEIQLRKAFQRGLNLAHDWIREGNSNASLARLVLTARGLIASPEMQGRFEQQLMQVASRWKYKKSTRN